ncbi:MAG: nicotinate-nucleotide--dimethylbenzimidazole phosphoribosyltransferase [Lachnospiraceae bacterium]|nr:nicotinate-nucleotide--dimethylbenzimidazole phosphoribosyltransferase [Lachnospiraceae bacterium]MBQ9609491.1 nicotinate-nucleotide--dimethylbenzimidazole phosphoribosyltransferase [Lachnospiraceae bacterium]
MDCKIFFEDVLTEKYNITSPDSTYYASVKKRWDNAAKPLDSLGIFEDIIARMGSILKTDDLKLDKKAVIVMCADNGVVEEGISQSGSDVTLAVASAMGENKSSVCRMAAVNNTKIIPVDIGIKSDEIIPGVLDRKVAKGTRNFAKEPAMTKEEMCCAIQIGMDMVSDLKHEGYSLIGTGEMGIGNTTTSSAVAMALLKRDAKELVGRGAGLSDEGLDKKKSVISDALKKYELNGPDADVLTILQTVGGLDIAGLVGVIIGGAVYHIPIVLDGVISAVAALVAVRIFPGVKDYIFASHIGREPAMKYIFEELELKPVIFGELALGEGTGAVMMFSLLDMALSLYNEQTTFEDIKIEAYKRFI